MTCPFCGKDMLEGYLHIDMTIWSERKHKISLLPRMKERYALKIGRNFLHPTYVQSDYCPDCERIIIDASPYDSSQGGE